MSTNESINVQEVVARFRNSAEVLDELRSRLASLTKTDDLHTATLESTQQTAQSLAEMAAYLRDATDALKSAIATADLALDTATRFMEATDLSEVGRQLSGVVQNQNELKTDLLGQITHLKEQVQGELAATRLDLDAVRAELVSTQAERDQSDSEVARLTAELEALRSRINAMPDRVKAKHGL